MSEFRHSTLVSPAPAAATPVLRAMDLDAMCALMATGGFEPFRAKQLYHWVYVKGIEELDEARNLPAKLRAWLAEHACIGVPERVRVTGEASTTQKLLLRLSDGKLIESVVMRDDESGRTSLCVSSQVGCAVGCRFCLTGFGGFQRDLTIDEIVGQVLAARRHVLGGDEPIGHLVFMGMGEPMLNLDAVGPAIRLLTDPDGIKLSRRRVTVSTSGILPGIERFGREDLGVGLAVSLNATTDQVRSAIMPINRKWPIAALIAALRAFPIEARRRITIEYVLLRGINDTPEDAQRLATLLHGLPCKVNLIMFNPSPHLPYEAVDAAALDRFTAVLSAAHFTVTVRWSRGREIDAACGQLAAHHFEQQGGAA